MPPDTADAEGSSGEGAVVTGVACGSSHSLALLGSRGLVVSWGRGEDGQLGHGDAEERTQPQAIFGLLNAAVSSVYCGAEYSLAISRSRREVWSWGWGDFGRLGHGDATDKFVPTPIAAFSGTPVAAAACGDTHTLVLSEAGEVWAFGRNQNGQLGTGSDVDSVLPQKVAALEGKRVVSVACGAEHSVCCTDQGEVYAWGWGRYGNLGDGECSDRRLPVKVKGLEGVRVAQVACGWRHSAAVDDAGRLYVWGWGRWGQLGLGDCNDAWVPRQVAGLQDIALVAGGWRHMLAADSSGAVWAWGWGKFGQLGLGNNQDVVESPQRLEALSGERAVRLASGWRHSMVATQSGKVYTWGRGVNGQLGHGDSNDYNVPKLLGALSSGSLSVDALSREAVHPSVKYSVPAADRYAVVPDSGQDDAAVPDSKRLRV
ncbi:hypothetical protein N2152v2_001303 [Parachlorella kessleri]